MAEIKTAEDVVKSLDAHRDRQRREQKQHDAAYEAERDRLEAYEDLRDEVMSLVKNSQLSYEDIHGRCGPHPSTLAKWAEQQTKFPRLGKLQSTARICGYDIGVIEGRRGVSKVAAE